MFKYLITLLVVALPAVGSSLPFNNETNRGNNFPSNDPRTATVSVIVTAEGDSIYVLEFDGVDDVALSIAGFDWDSDGNHTELAVSCWVYCDDATGHIPLVTQGIFGEETADRDLSFRLFRSGAAPTLSFFAFTGGTGAFLVQSTDSVVAGCWAHLAVSIATDGTGSPDYNVWFDGNEDTEATLTDYAESQYDSLYVPHIDTGLVCIGGLLKWAGTREISFAGEGAAKIAGIRIMNAAPTTAQVESLMISTDPTKFNTSLCWNASPGTGQTINDATGNCFGYRGETENIEASDCTWGDSYNESNSSGPITFIMETFPHWSWNWLSWLFPESAFADNNVIKRYTWGFDKETIALVDSLWNTKNYSFNLGSGSERVGNVSKDTIQVYSTKINIIEANTIKNDFEDYLRFWVEGGLPDSLDVIPFEDWE